MTAFICLAQSHGLHNRVCADDTTQVCISGCPETQFKKRLQALFSHSMQRTMVGGNPEHPHTSIYRTGASQSCYRFSYRFITINLIPLSSSQNPTLGGFKIVQLLNSFEGLYVRGLKVEEGFTATGAYTILFCCHRKLQLLNCITVFQM